ncbi:hypothetical protein ACELLULO517_07715 [Acidisoma cellulosilytica]|uniref:Uncharacterized protein n=1 Tax=Acidisoma cellulosilyticum TaxID=2802395 RepID=A0A963Z1J3_9PROT|nr:hypothetical protein [Acidisoma cellulosilyticum]MCB8880118.1 hypothetical protein [Acidisoma cellulosilyticum]
MSNELDDSAEEARRVIFHVREDMKPLVNKSGDKAFDDSLCAVFKRLDDYVSQREEALRAHYVKQLNSD